MMHTFMMQWFQYLLWVKNFLWKELCCHTLNHVYTMKFVWLIIRTTRDHKVQILNHGWRSFPTLYISVALNESQRLRICAGPILFAKLPVLIDTYTVDRQMDILLILKFNMTKKYCISIGGVSNILQLINFMHTQIRFTPTMPFQVIRYPCSCIA